MTYWHFANFKFEINGNFNAVTTRKCINYSSLFQNEDILTLCVSVASPYFCTTKL